jgi:hypothetical protein
MLLIIFAVAAVEPWQELQLVGKGGEVRKFIGPLFRPECSIFWTFWAASYGKHRAFQIPFLLLVLKKTHTNDIFAR